MILTGKALKDFIKWLYKKHNLQPYNCFNDVILHATIIEWFDSISIFIHIEPNIGGGASVFYPEIIYRNKDFIDIHEKVENTKYMPTEMYFDSRQEATKQAIIKANEIYNLQITK